MEKQKTCGECKNYFKANFSTNEPSYFSGIKRSCLENRLLDLEDISATMGLTEEKDPLIKSCTHFEPKEEAKEETNSKKKKK